MLINILRPRQNGCHFQGGIFKRILVNQNAWISIKSSPKFVHKDPNSNVPALVPSVYAPVNLSIIASDDGVMPVGHQAITNTKSDIFVLDP